MKPSLIVLALISFAGLAIILMRLMPTPAASRSSSFGVESVRTGTCVDRYNSMLKNAKSSLIAGDRVATLHLLEQAKHMIPACPALQDVASPETVLLSLNPCDGAAV